MHIFRYIGKLVNIFANHKLFVCMAFWGTYLSPYLLGMHSSKLENSSGEICRLVYYTEIWRTTTNCMVSKKPRLTYIFCARIETFC